MQNRIELPFDMPSECVVDCDEVDADRIYYSSVAAVDNYYYSLLNSHYAYLRGCFCASSLLASDT